MTQGRDERAPELRWDRAQFRPGERVAAAVSGGADSVALFRAMVAARAAAGLVLSAVHVNHGLRGAESDEDAAFVRRLTEQHQLPVTIHRADVQEAAARHGKGIEETARALRYDLFRRMLDAGEVDAVVTAHTLDDQAETVLMKLLRGAWTEGLSGIAPVMSQPRGRIVRPLLTVTRADVIAYLEGLGQTWREDASNRDPAFTRNRVRHELLPQVTAFAPDAAIKLARVAAIARDEEAWWTRELARLLPGLVLPGRPVRGGGRANSTRPGEQSLSIELDRLAALHPAVARRVLRAAAEQLGHPLSFDETESLRALAADGSGRGRRLLGLAGGVVAERTARELQLRRGGTPLTAALPAITIPVPGAMLAEKYGLHVTTQGELLPETRLVLRTPKAGDRVVLRHSRSPKSVKDVLERAGWSAEERAHCPVIAIESTVGAGRIAWLRGVDVEPEPGLAVLVTEGSATQSGLELAADPDRDAVIEPPEG